MSKLTYLFLLLFSVPTHASDWVGNIHNRIEGVPGGITLQKVANLTNDKNSNINYLNIMIDRNGLAAGMYSEADSRNVPGEGGGGQNVFWLRDIESPNGVVMSVAQGRDVLIMKGSLNRETQEGKFAIKYLSNGLTMTYKSCDFLLKKSAGKWWIRNAYTAEKVSKIHVETWSLGISTLKGICPN